MFCPVCGLESTKKQRFCRSCGTDLGLVMEALGGRLLDLRMAEIDRDYQRDLFGGTVFLLSLVLMILTGLKFAVGTVGQDDFGPLVLVLGWMTVALFGAIFALARHRRKIRRQLLEKDLGTRSEPEDDHLADFRQIAPPSITEQTTARLSEEVRLPEEKREYE